MPFWGRLYWNLLYPLHRLIFRGMAMHKLLTAFAFLVLATPAFAAEKDVVDTAVSAGSFKTLVAAVKAAGLVDDRRDRFAHLGPSRAGRGRRAFSARISNGVVATLAAALRSPLTA